MLQEQRLYLQKLLETRSESQRFLFVIIVENNFYSNFVDWNGDSPVVFSKHKIFLSTGTYEIKITSNFLMCCEENQHLDMV